MNTCTSCVVLALTAVQLLLYMSCCSSWYVWQDMMSYYFAIHPSLILHMWHVFNTVHFICFVTPYSTLYCVLCLILHTWICIVLWYSTLGIVLYLNTAHPDLYCLLICLLYNLKRIVLCCVLCTAIGMMYVRRFGQNWFLHLSLSLSSSVRSPILSSVSFQFPLSNNLRTS